MTPTIRDIIISVIVAAIASMGTLSVARTELRGELKTSDVEQSRVFLSRIEGLEKRLDAQGVMLAQLGIENSMLKNENDQLKLKVSLLESQDRLGPDSRTDAVFDLFSDWQSPAWCKEVVINDDSSVSFIAAFSNPWFEFTYNINSDIFVGSTDFDIFEPAQAEEYYRSDMATYKSRGWEDFLAPRPMPDGSVGPQVRFKKLYHRVTDGPELICGWEVE